MSNSAENRGTITRRGNLLHVENALVEQVSLNSQCVGNILVSYSVLRGNDLLVIEQLQLNIGKSTVIRNAQGRQICPSDIRVGMWIDALFSPFMTRSIPPQSNAFMITLRQQAQPQTSVTTDRVACVDLNNNSLYTGNPRNINSQIQFNITNTTVIQDRNGRTISLRAISPGNRVRITHSSAMTASIPPQTTAFRVERL